MMSQMIDKWVTNDVDCADDEVVDDDEVGGQNNDDWTQYANTTSEFPVYVIEVLMVIDYAIYRRYYKQLLYIRCCCLSNALHSISIRQKIKSHTVSGLRSPLSSVRCSFSGQSVKNFKWP